MFAWLDAPTAGAASFDRAAVVRGGTGRGGGAIGEATGEATGVGAAGAAPSGASFDPSRVQNRASSAYMEPQVGQRMLTPAFLHR